MTFQHTDHSTDTDRLAEIGQALNDLDTVVDGASGVKGRYGWNFSGVSQHVNMHSDLKFLLSLVEQLQKDRNSNALLWAETFTALEESTAANTEIANVVVSQKAELEAAQARLDAVAELHTIERRYTDESYERSYDTRQEAAEALGITPGAAVYLDVCSHCGSIEMDAGADDYRESLWPCPTVEALGLGDEAEIGGRACDHRQCPPNECQGC